MQPKQFCHFLTLRLENSIVLHVLKNTLVNLSLRKEGGYSEKLLMTFYLDEGLMGGIFLYNPHKNLPKFGQILNMSKICVHGMQKLSRASHLIMIKMLLALGVLQVGAAIAFQNCGLKGNDLSCASASCSARSRETKQKAAGRTFRDNKKTPWVWCRRTSIMW